MDATTAAKLTNDILACLAVASDERLTVSDLIGALRASWFRSAERGDAKYRWSFSHLSDLVSVAERLGFVAFYSVNERNQRGQYIALSETHPHEPVTTVKEGFVIVASYVSTWARHNKRSVVSRYSGRNRQLATKLADAKVYKTRKGAEKAATKAVGRSKARRERFEAADINDVVITVTEFLARNA